MIFNYNIKLLVICSHVFAALSKRLAMLTSFCYVTSLQRKLFQRKLERCTSQWQSCLPLLWNRKLRLSWLSPSWCVLDFINCYNLHVLHEAM